MTVTYKRLGDLATYINGYAFRPENWSTKGLPIIRIQNLTGSSNDINYYDGNIDKKYVVRNGDILIAWSASLGVYEWDGEDALLNQHIFKVVFDKENINKNFFKFMVQKVLERTQKYLHGSTMKHITKKYFDSLLIPFPPLEIQEKIADTLLLAESLVNKRKAQIEALDQLAQSVFLEMFGDPSINPKKWRMMSLEEIAKKEKGAIKSGPFGSQLLISEYVKDGIPVLGIDNVEKNKFVWAKPKAISEEKYKELISFRVYSGDVLISRTGTVGRTCVVPDNFKEGIIGPNLLKVTLDTNLMLPEVLSIMFNYLPYVINQIKWMSPGATVPVFNTKNLKKVKVLVPDINVQAEFVKNIKKIEQQKSKFLLGIKYLEDNYNAIMQRAFKGELFPDEQVSNL